MVFYMACTISPIFYDVRICTDLLRQTKPYRAFMAISSDFEWTLLSILASALLSGLLGVLISNWYYKRNETKRAKRMVLQQLVGNRFNVRGEAFIDAINQTFVVFYDSKEVLTALKAFHEYSMSNNRIDDIANQKLLDLFKAMCKHLNIETDPLTDNFFLRPFNA